MALCLEVHGVLAKNIYKSSSLGLAVLSLSTRKKSKGKKAQCGREIEKKEERFKRKYQSNKHQ